MATLSVTQRYALAWVATTDAKSSELHAGTRASLLRLGLIEWRLARLRITDAGREALKANGMRRSVHCSRCGGSGIDPEIRGCSCDCCAGTGIER